MGSKNAPFQTINKIVTLNKKTWGFKIKQIPDRKGK